MSRPLACAALAVFLVASLAPRASAQKKKVEITKKWNGSVEDRKLPQPECITSTKGLEAVWKAWMIEGEVPKIDFTKNIVVAVYSVGSKLNLAGASLDDKGNLEALGIGTRD